eukprot:scaffold30339_cov32-Tisochrysis_lutea.AAC.8
MGAPLAVSRSRPLSGFSLPTRGARSSPPRSVSHLSRLVALAMHGMGMGNDPGLGEGGLLYSCRP